MAHIAVDPTNRTRTVARVLGIAVLLVLAVGVPAAWSQVVKGRIQGKIVATDNGEPVAFADVKLLPADTTLRPVGGLTNADGTFLLEAAPGRYTLQITALSYARKRIEGVLIEEGKLLPFNTALTPEAIMQEEIVVEARRQQNTEASLLSARKKAASLGDAVSAEQVRRSPDKDAAEVLRRVTGLSVADGKYVFVRGLGERYSSTEVDGVRIVSPEQNKRVVPLDLLPANLLDNIVVQKTYTSDRPAEFGGGDVQVRTKDFPGSRTWSFSASQGWAEGVTLQDRRTYVSTHSDILGFGAADRGIPSGLDGVPVPQETPSNHPLLADMALLFSHEWSPTGENTIPNSSYSATYGDEFQVFGRSLGLIQSWSFARSFDRQDESQRLYRSVTDTVYNYASTRWNENVQLGGLGGLSYRLSPRHSLHLRGFYSNTAEDEVRTYEGDDHNSYDVDGTYIVRRNTRYLYVQRSILSGTLEGKHEVPTLHGLSLDWKLTRSVARRQQPDRREFTYDRTFWYPGDTAHWVMQGRASREYGDLKDNGYGTTLSAAMPYRLGGLGTGKLHLGFDHQVKERDNFYRRFFVYQNRNVDQEANPDSIYSPSGYDGGPASGYVQDYTYSDPLVGLDNYKADQRFTSGFLSIDVPFGRRLRANLGVRVEKGLQDVRSFALFAPSVILERGEIQGTDVLPSSNLTWSATDVINVRIAASRTISRPDLNELSPSPFLEYIGGALVRGNPALKRAQLVNYDLRVEAFPSLGEVLATGVFYKRLHDPIEQVYKAATTGMLLVPYNSASGRNVGVELEARVGLGRVAKAMERFSINSNASLISSRVTLPPQTSQLGSQEHPLQGQASWLLNAALSYAGPVGTNFSVMLNATGRRLRALGIWPTEDVYTEPFTTLDVTVNSLLFRSVRLKASARNMLDLEARALQGGREVTAYRTGRSFTLELSVGS